MGRKISLIALFFAIEISAIKCDNQSSKMKNESVHKQGLPTCTPSQTKEAFEGWGPLVYDSEDSGFILRWAKNLTALRAVINKPLEYVTTCDLPDLKFGIIGKLAIALIRLLTFSHEYILDSKYLQELNKTQRMAYVPWADSKKFLSSVANDFRLWKAIETNAQFYQKFNYDCSNFVDQQQLQYILLLLNYRRTRGFQFWDTALNNELQDALRRCMRESGVEILKKAPYDPFFLTSPINIITQIIPQSLIDLTNDGEVTLSAIIDVQWRNNIWVSLLPNQPIENLVLTLEPNEIWTPTIWIDRCIDGNCLIVPSNYTQVYYAPNHGGILYAFKEI